MRGSKGFLRINKKSIIEHRVLLTPALCARVQRYHFLKDGLLSVLLKRNCGEDAILSSTTLSSPSPGTPEQEYYTDDLLYGPFCPGGKTILIECV